MKTRYKDVDDYISTYEPLIFEEAKSQIIKEKEDEEGIFNFFFLPILIWAFFPPNIIIYLVNGNASRDFCVLAFHCFASIVLYAQGQVKLCLDEGMIISAFGKVDYKTKIFI